MAAQTGGLRGRVTDETGAVVPGARVEAAGPGGVRRSATSGGDGGYSIRGLAAGAYRVAASAPEMATPAAVRVEIGSGATTLDLRLAIVSRQEQVTVEDSSGAAVSTEASANAGALVLRGKDLETLADDPDDLASDLQALAGPSAGPNGGALYVDGFSGGELPQKDSIREVRINQNPFSPEYDTLGYGRVEIFTKAGADAWHGTGYFNFGDSVWNSRNPYAADKAPFLLKEYGGEVTGPLGKKVSVTLDLQRAAIDNGAIINGTTLDPVTLEIVNPYTQVYSIPQRRIVASPRIDYQMTPNNTLSVRYSVSRGEIGDQGVGSFNLVSQGYDVRMLNQTLQATDTWIAGTGTVNTTRFQYFRPASSMAAVEAGPAIQVLNAFVGGGSPVGNSSDTQDSFEVQNYTVLERGAHSWHFGARLRGTREDSVSRQNFNGTYTFGGGTAPELDAANQPVTGSDGQTVMVTIPSIERYRRTLLFTEMGYPESEIRALGGGASQFTMSAGVPGIVAGQFDAGVFAGDEWKVRRNVTLSLGVRYENQTNIGDNRDVAPRVGIAWAPGGGNAPKTVIRAGFGVFYDRFALTNTITAKRYDGVTQQQYVVTNPAFFGAAAPPAGALAEAQAASAIQEVSANLKAPSLAQWALAVERQLAAKTTLTVTYSGSRGLHQLNSNDINAPLPGSGLYPFGEPNPIFLMESDGVYNQNQLIVNVNSRISSRVSLFGSYTYNSALSNTDGLLTFPANPYSMAGEYGPALTDVRHRATAGGTISGPWGLQFSPLVTAMSGPPFNITVGHDLYGDTLFNGRPGIVTDPSRAGVVATQYGLLDPNPVAGERLAPRNYGRGPGMIMANLRLTKNFQFGEPRQAGGDARYRLSVGVSMRNILNHNNPGAIIGDITSPLFGQANQPYGVTALGGTGFSESANNRRLEIQTRFTF